MARFLKTYLIFTGALVGLIFVFPIVLLFGPVFGVMPTAFLWGAVFAAVWFPARSRLDSRGAFFVACATIACLAFLPPLLVNRYLADSAAQARAGDKLPGSGIAVTGVLRMEREANKLWRPLAADKDGLRRFACDDFCAAALFTPGIEAVVVAATPAESIMLASSDKESTAAYRLQRGDRCLEPLLPEVVQDDLGKWADIGDLRTSHRLALSRGVCLTRDDTVPAANWTLRLDRETLHGVHWMLRPLNGTVYGGVGTFALLGTTTQTRLSLDRHNARVLQWTEVETQPLAPVLFSSAVGGIFSDFRFGWLRSERTDGRFDAVEVLARATNLRLSPSTSPTPAPTGEAIRDTLNAALVDPALPAGAAAFSLVGPLFNAMGSYAQRRDVRPSDAGLIARAVADARVRDLFGIAWAVQALGPDAAALRAPMVARVLAARVPEDRIPADHIGRALAYFPPGAFATPTPDEQRLLADPVRRRWATGLIERQADRGAAAAPGLVAIIAQAYGRPAKADRDVGSDRVGDARAALRALCLIGPAASEQFAALAGLIESGVVPRNVLDDHEWRFTLARISGAVEGVTRVGSVSPSREPPKRGPWPTLTRFQPEYCR